MGIANLMRILISCLVAIAILIEPLIMLKTKRKKFRSYWSKHIEAENNELPKNVNWNGINEFLKETKYGLNMPDNFWFMLNWEIQPCVKDEQLSKKSIRVLQCLSKDMHHLYHNVHIYYDRGPQVEDKDAKYQYVKEILNTKYDKLSEQLREMIYEQFVTTYDKR